MYAANALVDTIAKRVVAANDSIADLGRQPFALPRTKGITLADALAFRDAARQRYGAAEKKVAEALIYLDNAAFGAFLVCFTATLATMEMRRPRGGQPPAK